MSGIFDGGMFGGPGQFGSEFGSRRLSGSYGSPQQVEREREVEMERAEKLEKQCARLEQENLYLMRVAFELLKCGDYAEGLSEIAKNNARFAHQNDMPTLRDLVQGVIAKADKATEEEGA